MATARETQTRDPQPVEQVDDLLPKQNEPEQPNRKEDSENRSSGTEAAAPLWREMPPSSVNR